MENPMSPHGEAVRFSLYVPYTVLILEGRFSRVPPAGAVLIYELLDGLEGLVKYVGQTSQPLRARIYTHVHLARTRAGKNRRLEAWLRRRMEGRQPIVVRIADQVDMADAVETERSLIAKRRAELGPDLLNLGRGGETAPIGRRVPVEERLRAAEARREGQRRPAYRSYLAHHPGIRRVSPDAYNRLLLDFAARGLEETREAICREHGLPANSLTTILDGSKHGLVVDPTALAAARHRAGEIKQREEAHAARVLAACDAFLRAPVGTTLASVSRKFGLHHQRLSEAVRRGAHGLPHDLLERVHVRLRSSVRHRARMLGARQRQVDPRTLKSLLTAYTRPGSRLTIAEVGRRLGVTQSRVSAILHGRTDRPLPRRLVRACRKRAQTNKGARSRALRLLTETQVAQARQLRAGGMSLRQIAEMLGVTKDVIFNVLAGRSYNR